MQALIGALVRLPIQTTAEGANVMTEQARARLRRIMQIAWDFFREAKRIVDARTFGDCLAGAWRMSKRLAEAAAELWRRAGPARHLSFSKDLIQSPSSRRWRGDPVNEAASSYLSSMVGR